MKLFTLSALFVSLTALTACADTASQPAQARTIELGGAQARTTIVLPQSDKVASSDAPYSLQGTPARNAATPTGTGYQAR